MRLLIVVIALLAFADASSAQMKVRVNWSAIAAGQSGIWIAHDEGLFKKNGLDVELLHIPSSSLIIQTMLAGEIAISYVDGRNAMQSNLTGSDVVLIAGTTNRFPFTFMARPEFKRVSELRGKRVGVTRVGSSTHTVTLYVLNQAGLKPGDYEIVPLGEVPNILVAMSAGRIDAGPLSSPTTIRARKAGLVELTNPAKDGPEYVSIAVGATRAYIRANTEIVRRFMRAYAEAVQLFKTNKTIALKALQKYTRVKDQEILEETQNEYRNYIESIPYVSRKGVETILTELAANDPKARQAKPDDFVDMRFVAEMERDGFFRKLGAK
ncbi:MAG TPA: ABC transporter substrate-binding protein [Candidatus Binatus sp.]|nr:ABC transporter substrate-binding protein [Candidatus Binatus sp.]